ncbi:hypothetical protein Syun_007052 [Stephania yunnanensis]|uniref:Uncharacterized protein n=1 Tax=Stephania yunnanensis TaxID=152371 RepID=A0AAP0KY36_9MAGN
MARGRGRGNPDDEDMEDINRHPEETSTSGRGSLSHHATPAHPDGRYSLHYTQGWSHVTRPYPTYAPGSSSSHYTSSSPPGHPYPYQHGTPSPPVHALPAQHGFIPSSSHHSTPSPPADVYPYDHGTSPSSSHHATPSLSAHPTHSPGVFFTWDLQMSFAIYDAWCRKAAIQYTGNIYHIAKKRIAPMYLTEEVFEHSKRMRATDEAFKKKFEQMSTNRKSEVGGSSTGISLHNAGSISARKHGDTLEKKLQCRPTEKMFRHLHTHGHDGQSFVDQRSAKIDTPDTSIDKVAIYLEVVLEVKGCVYGLRSQGYHCGISLREGSSSRGQAYGPHELEELQRDHQRSQETLLKDRMERQEKMQRDKMERQEET